MPQVQSIDEFHDQVIKSARLAEVVDGDDIWVIQCRQGLCLAAEPLGKLNILRAFRGKKLKGDEAVEALLLRLVDHAHTAAAEAFENFKLRKERGNLLHSLRRLRRVGFTG